MSFDDPEPPFLFVDNGNWINVYDSVEDLVEDQESAFLDEVALLLDSRARPMNLVAHDDAIRLEMSDSETDLARLQDSVDQFFHQWTDTPPPRHHLSSNEYLSEVFARYRSASFRGKKRKPE
jgi:hypothetical protein